MRVIFNAQQEGNAMSIHTRTRAVGLILTVILLMALMPGALAEANYAYVSTSGARMYMSADLFGASGGLSKNTLLSVISVDGGVAKVKWRSYTGYIDKSKITLLDDGYEAEFKRAGRVYEYPSNSARSAKVGAGTRVSVLAVAGGGAIVEKNGVLAYARMSDLTKKGADAEPADPITKCDFDACITGDSLNVYSAASTNSLYLGALNKDVVFRVTAYNSTWAFITYNSRSGFVLKSGIKKYEAPAPKPDDMFADVVYAEFPAQVTAGSLKIYRGEPESSESLGALEKGEIITVTAYTNNWARVTYNGESGFCKISGLTKYTPPKYTEEGIFSSDKSNEEKLYLYFTEIAGLSPAAACGILANVRKECNFRPDNLSSSGAFGICQWMGGRKSNLIAYCADIGEESSSLRGQARFVMKEMKEKYSKVYSYMTSVENTAQGAYDAGYYFCYYYEIPANREGSSVARGNLAKDTYWPKYVK